MKLFTLLTNMRFLSSVTIYLLFTSVTICLLSPCLYTNSTVSMFLKNGLESVRMLLWVSIYWFSSLARVTSQKSLSPFCSLRTHSHSQTLTNLNIELMKLMDMYHCQCWDAVCDYQMMGRDWAATYHLRIVHEIQYNQCSTFLYFRTLISGVIRFVIDTKDWDKDRDRRCIHRSYLALLVLLLTATLLPSSALMRGCVRFLSVWPLHGVHMDVSIFTPF